MVSHQSNVFYSGCLFERCKVTWQDYDLLQWASAIESLEFGNPGSDQSFGMKQRPDGDIEIDEKFWEEDFHIPTCQKCNGVLKPDVSFCFLWSKTCTDEHIHYFMVVIMALSPSSLSFMWNFLYWCSCRWLLDSWNFL